MSNLRQPHRRTGTIKTIGRDLPNRDYIEIEAVEDDGSGGFSPGFVITATGWEKRGTRSGRDRSRNAHGKPRDCDFAGCNHDVILTAAPELAPIVTAHLADLDGVPMHALSNGWHFYSGASAAVRAQALRRGVRRPPGCQPRPRRACAAHRARGPARRARPRRASPRSSRR